MYAAALLLEFAALIALRLHEPKMKRPVRVPGGWFGVLLVTALPSAVLALALYSTYVEEGWSAIWMSAAAIATGPLLYPFLVRFVKKALPTGSVEVESAQTESAAAGVRVLRSGFRRYRLRRAQFSQAQLT